MAVVDQGPFIELFQELETRTKWDTLSDVRNISQWTFALHFQGKCTLSQ